MRAGGVVFTIVLVILGVMLYAGSHQQAEVVSCNQVLGTCTSTTYPVTPESP